MSVTLIKQAPAERDRAAPVMPEACASGGCGGPDPRLADAPPSFGTVRVNGVVIEPEEIAAEIQHHPAASGEAAWRAAARALVVRELLLAEARRRGIAATPEQDEAGRRETESEATVRALLEAVVDPDPADEAACRRYYDAERHRFRTPELFEASHILIEPEGDDDEAWSLAEADACAIAEAVGDDPGAFAAAAKEASACPSALQGGSLGQVRRGELVPAVQDALEGLAEGTTRREPLATRFGVHVLRLERRIPGHVLPFEMVAPKIAEMLDARAWAIAAADFAARLAREADIEGVLVSPAEIAA